MIIANDYLSEKQRIENEIQKLAEKVSELQKRHRGPALEAIVQAMHEYEITLKEVNQAFKRSGKPATSGSKSGSARPPKYRNPQTGATWSGMGRTPAWLVTAEEQGHNRDEFLI